MSPIKEAYFFVTLLSLLFFSQPATAINTWQAQDDPRVRINSPASGDVLRGVVSIDGATELPEFQSAEVAFAYQNDSTGTWFLIQQTDVPVVDDTLANWDTSLVTDGQYRLRLQVFLMDGSVLERQIDHLRIRNYTPIETEVPKSGDGGADRKPVQATSRTPLPDFQAAMVLPTPLPTNPAQVTGEHMQLSALRGVLVVLIALIVAGGYIGIRELTRR